MQPFMRMSDGSCVLLLREGSAEEEPWEAATGATGRRTAAVNADAVRQEQEGRANAKKTAKATWSAILRASSGRSFYTQPF